MDPDVTISCDSDGNPAENDDNSMDPPATATSSLYSVLPGFVRRHVQPLPSIRRTCCSLLVGTVHISRPQADINDEDNLYRAIPRQRPVSAGSDLSGSTLASPDSTPSRRGSFDGGIPVRPRPLVCDSGVNWKYAYEGYSLIDRAVRESSTFDQEPELTRKLYLDGVAYLLRGLPADAGELELLQLKHALPFSGGALTAMDAEVLLNPKERPTPPARRSMTYEASTRATFYMLFLVNMFLPYLRALLAQAYQCDRRYRVSDRIVAAGVLAGGEFCQLKHKRGLLMRE